MNLNQQRIVITITLHRNQMEHMSCAIVAKKMGVKVAHLVAGTRSFDMNQPKEVNRMITDGLSDFLFTAGAMANRNLNQSGREEENVYYVGNILIDTIRRNRTRLLKPLWASAMQLDEGKYILLTLNRRKLLKDKVLMKSLLTTLSQKAAGAMIIAPLHTYVSDSIKKLGLKLPNINIMPVQNYLVFGYLANHGFLYRRESGQYRKA